MIKYSIPCNTCEAHRTAYGTLMSTWETIMKNETIASEYKLDVWKVFYEQLCLDRRTHMIQGFKKENIKEINK